MRSSGVSRLNPYEEAGWQQRSPASYSVSMGTREHIRNHRAGFKDAFRRVILTSGTTAPSRLQGCIQMLQGCLQMCESHRKGDDGWCACKASTLSDHDVHAEWSTQPRRAPVQYAHHSRAQATHMGHKESSPGQVQPPGQHAQHGAHCTRRQQHGCCPCQAPTAVAAAAAAAACCIQSCAPPCI
eukprot:1157138-Pelagomonas_calceolata.AAC.3